MPTSHVLNPTVDSVHWGYFDAEIPPRLTVDSGDTVVVDTVSGRRRELGNDLSRLGRVHREIPETVWQGPGPHILTGPIAVRGPCSLACDLRVTQLVDGNKGIHAMVSRDLLSAAG